MSLELYARKNAAKNWDQICLKKAGNELLLASCNQSEGNWVSSIRSTFEKFDLSDVYLNETPSTTTATYCQLFDCEKVVFTQSALSSIQTLPKMRTYRLLVQNLGPKDYLFTTRDVKNRVAMTKLRLSNHNLSIEKGRHQDVHLSDRNCPFCPEHLENEFHFLIQCPIYKNLRAR